jgi:BlaI family transcriptional regulator, penicillinase repressor
VVDRIPSERELDVLKVLWRIGEARVRDVHQALCPDGECAFTTVQTLLRIMYDKGLVYTIEEATSRFLNKLYDGAVDKCVLSMLSAEDVSADEMRVIEKMIAKARKTKESNEG